MANETKNATPATPEKATVVSSTPAPTPEPTIVFVVKSDSVLALQIGLTMEKAKKHNKDKGHFSIEYFCEEMLSEKLSTYSDYLDADEDRKNRELFVKSQNALTVPNVNDPTALLAYVQAIEALQRKHRQGSYKPAAK